MYQKYRNQTEIETRDEQCLNSMDHVCDHFQQKMGFDKQCLSVVDNCCWRDVILVAGMLS